MSIHLVIQMPLILNMQMITQFEMDRLALDGMQRNRGKPIDYEAMKANVPFKNALKTNLLLRGIMIMTYRGLKSDVLGLIAHIESELEILTE
jgi:hypothetical protein